MTSVGIVEGSFDVHFVTLRIRVQGIWGGGRHGDLQWMWVLQVSVKHPATTQLSQSKLDRPDQTIPYKHTSRQSTVQPFGLGTSQSVNKATGVANQITKIYLQTDKQIQWEKCCLFERYWNWFSYTAKTVTTPNKKKYLYKCYSYLILKTMYLILRLTSLT